MRTAIHAGFLIAALACTAWPLAASARHAPVKSVAASRIGLINARSPSMGPKLVKRDGYTAITDMVRPRFVGGMIDIYPRAQSGFRFSVGNRYFSRPNFWSAAEQATRGLIYNPRTPRGSVRMQTSFRRFTPAITMGYDVVFLPGLVAGIEGGALNGRAISPGPRGRAFRPGDSKANAAGLNPVATLAIRYAF